MTPSATEFQPRCISHTGNQRLDLPSLCSQEGFLKGLSSRPEASQNDFDTHTSRHSARSLNTSNRLCGIGGHLLAASTPLLLSHLAEEICGQLVGCIVGAALCFSQADVAGRHGEDGVAAGLSEGQVHVVFVGVDVKVVGLRAADFRVLCVDGVLLCLGRELLAQILAEPAEVAASCSLWCPQCVHHSVLCLGAIGTPWLGGAVAVIATAGPIDSPSLCGGLWSWASGVLGIRTSCLCDVRPSA